MCVAWFQPDKRSMTEMMTKAITDMNKMTKITNNSNDDRNNHSDECNDRNYGRNNHRKRQIDDRKIIMTRQ